MSGIAEIVFIFISYYFGFYIRYKTDTKTCAMSLFQQLLGSIPVFFLVMALLFPIVEMALDSTSLPATLAVVGILLEQGFLYREAIARYRPGT